ncbi:MAG: hypothetical protein INF43_03360 [Alphaproteobacteria bacterium]|nr:hypothetical protein [Alphaproteobacteria bacterium]
MPPPLWAVLACAALVGCTGPGQRGPLASFPAPQPLDGGVEIARTTMLPGATAQNTQIGTVADCYGPGMGVLVETARGSEKLLFDAQGEPCGNASLLFDGSNPLGQRQADPAVTIRVHDGFGALLEERPSAELPSRTARSSTLPPVPQISVNDTLLPVVAEGEDPLAATLNAWQQGDNFRATQSERATAAGTRELTRLVAQAADQSSGAAAAALAAQLREQERLLEDERRRHETTLADSAQNRAMTQAQRDAWQQEQNRLQSELAAAKTRAAQFEQLASRLQQEKARQKATMGERIATLSGSLKLAEQQAEAGRRELILQAAAKVAEAQALATAARMETQNDQLAEASRLHAQANQLMDQVLTARGEGAIEPAAGAVPALPLDQAPVVLQAKERTLPDILNEVLQQAATHSGAWRAEWQLGEQGQALLAERWSLTAEATVGQILANLNTQVQAEHKFSLAFTPFTQTKVLVITLAGDTAKEQPHARP